MKENDVWHVDDELMELDVRGGDAAGGAAIGSFSDAALFALVRPARPTEVRP